MLVPLDPVGFFTGPIVKFLVQGNLQQIRWIVQNFLSPAGNVHDICIILHISFGKKQQEI